MTKTKKLIAATHNRDKLREFSRILEPLEIDLLPVPKGIMENVVENGIDFSENALIKARAAFKATGVPAMADDSGICIDALNGAPGVLSARYLGVNTPYSIKNAKIIELLKDVPEDKRTARFVCAIAVVTGDSEQVFSGVFEGKIGHEAKGKHGFGYDPIFCVNGKTSAEMSDQEKDALSHRGKALRAMSKKINEII